jgi:hypothetical protein
MPLDPEAARQAGIAREVDECIARAIRLEQNDRPDLVRAACEEVIALHSGSPHADRLRVWLHEFALRDIKNALTKGKNLELNGMSERAREVYEAVLGRHPSEMPELEEVRERLSALGPGPEEGGTEGADPGASRPAGHGD